MGTGDWNDGMNLVGAGGRGESVWLGWFLASLLDPFAAIADGAGRARSRLAPIGATQPSLSEALNGGVGRSWYRRAYFDDGTPLGSAANAECRIDAIAQSWAVISGRGEPERAREAMASTDANLVRRQDGLILLLTPPFDKTTPSPGYIQGYVPGVRENGGQYTHGVLWSVLAFARLGDGDKACELFSLLEPGESRADARAMSSATGRNRTSSPPTSTRNRPTPGEADGPGTPGRPAGCIASALEGILGLSLQRGALRVDPCIPRAWPRYELTYTVPQFASISIVVENPGRRESRRAAGRGRRPRQADHLIPIVDDGQVHHVRVVLGRLRPRDRRDTWTKLPAL